MLKRLNRKINKLHQRAYQYAYGDTAFEVLQSYRNVLVRDSNSEDKNHSFIVHYKNSGGNFLSALCDKYGSDKGSLKVSGHIYDWAPHSYADFYSLLFSHCREHIKTVFECGLGSNNPSIASNMGLQGKPGASLRVWRDYFPQAEIYGADIDADILFQENRIKTFYVDQTNPTSIADLWRAIDIQAFDIMIDDGLHTFEAGVCLYENSIERLAPNGLYIIEDVAEWTLHQFRCYFAKAGKEVSYVNLIRPNEKMGDNSLILIRNS